MSPKAFNHFGRKMLGLGAVALSLTVAACGSSSTSSTSSTPATAAPAACTVSGSDLSLGAGGTATAPKVTLTGKTLNIDGSSALQPLFKEAATSFDTVNGTTTTVNGNGSGSGLTGAANGSLDIGMSDIFQSEKAGISGLTDHQVAAVHLHAGRQPRSARQDHEPDHAAGQGHLRRQHHQVERHQPRGAWADHDGCPHGWFRHTRHL